MSKTLRQYNKNLNLNGIVSGFAKHGSPTEYWAASDAAKSLLVWPCVDRAHLSDHSKMLHGICPADQAADRL